MARPRYQTIGSKYSARIKEGVEKPVLSRTQYEYACLEVERYRFFFYDLDCWPVGWTVISQHIFYFALSGRSRPDRTHLMLPCGATITLVGGETMTFRIGGLCPHESAELLLVLTELSLKQPTLAI